MGEVMSVGKWGLVVDGGMGLSWVVGAVGLNWGWGAVGLSCVLGRLSEA